MKINGKEWNSLDDAGKEMGTDDEIFIKEMYRLVRCLHREVDWSNLETDEAKDACSQYFQSCTSRVRHFYNEVDAWSQREAGAPLIALSVHEQRKSMFEYAVLIDHPLRKHIVVPTEDDWWFAIR